MSFSLDSLDSMSIQYFRIGDLPGEFLDLAHREIQELSRQIAYSEVLYGHAVQRIKAERHPPATDRSPPSSSCCRATMPSCPTDMPELPRRSPQPFGPGNWGRVWPRKESPPAGSSDALSSCASPTRPVSEARPANARSPTL